MAAPTIPNGEEYFFPIIYSGNGQGQRVGKFVPFTDNGTISNSVIFNHSDTTMQLQLPAPASAGNQKTFTFSCWFKRAKLGDQSYLYSVWDGTDDGAPYLEDRHYAQWRTDNKLYINFWGNGVMTNRTFEDTSKWYHYLLAVDSTQSTAADRIKLYIDGDLVTSFSSTSYFAQDSNLAFPKRAFTIGNTKAGDNAQEPFDGYIAEFNAIEGQALTPSTFGLTDTSTGRWIPKTLSGITYGTNGFRLTFADSSALGDDTSGNTNDFTATNLASTDQTTDSPTQNFNNMGGSKNSGTTVAEGNLETTTPSGGTGYLQIVGLPAFGVNKGKWYWEVKITTVGTGLYGWKDDGNAGGSQASNSGTIGSGGNFAGALSAGSSGSYSAGSWFIDHDYNNEVNYTTVATNDVLMFALDLDNNKGYCGKNGTWFNSADPANGTGAIGGTQRANGVNKFYPMCARLGGSASTGEWNFGQRSFAYTAPTGFSALQQDNLPETAKGISGLVWTKNRDAADNHQLYDSSRGKQLALTSNTDGQETTVTDGLQRFLAGGQQIEGNDAINTSGESFVSWNWMANGSTTASNSDGSISSTVQANQTAGFSIVQYIGTGSNATVGHGLSSAPEWVMVKLLNQAAVSGFTVGCLADPGGFNNFLYLNESTLSRASSTTWNDTAPTSSVFSIGSSSTVNLSTKNFVAYCWHEVDGFSQFGKYVGNASTDGPFIYTGFKPAWVMVKNASGSSAWVIYDNKRNSFNPMDKYLLADSSAVEATAGSLDIDMVSNGFKIRGNDGGYNGSGITVIYMAFAEHPFVGDGTSPVTAR